MRGVGSLRSPSHALRPWLEAGLRTRNVSLGVDSWQRLHKLFGLALNDRVYADAPWRRYALSCPSAPKLR